MKISLMTEFKFVVAGLLVVGGIIGWGKWHHRTEVIISSPVPGVTSITIPGPITTKVVNQYISDPAQQILISKLIAENKKYQVTINSLTSSIGELKQKGGVGVNGGTITNRTNTEVTDGRDLPIPSENGAVLPDTRLFRTQAFTFSDFQLNANYTSDGRSFNYALSQSFSVVTTTGKDSSGKGVSIVKLFQTNGPNGSPINIPVVTTEIASAPNPVQWFFSPRIQGGFALGQGGEKGGLISLQWLRRGRSKSAEDSSFALLQPALTIGSGGAKLALIPAAINLGRIPHQPFTNIWLGGTINLDKQVGLSITATF